MSEQQALVPTFGGAEARRLTDAAKRDIGSLREKLLLLFEGEAHIALGYSSWGAYWETEFESHWRTGYRELEAARIGRAIGPWDNGKPPPERQARELVPLLRQEDEDAVIDLWVELQDEFGDDLTAEKVRNAVEKKLTPRATPKALSVPETDQTRSCPADAREGLRQGRAARARMAGGSPRRGPRAGLPADRSPNLAGARIERQTAGDAAVTTRDLSAHVRAECQRILDREARRLLLARMDGELVGPVPGGDIDALDHGADQVTAPLEGDLVPVTERVERDGRTGGGA